jgi:hypothetical protein
MPSTTRWISAIRDLRFGASCARPARAAPENPVPEPDLAARNRSSNTACICGTVARRATEAQPGRTLKPLLFPVSRSSRGLRRLITHQQHHTAQLLAAPSRCPRRSRSLIRFALTRERHHREKIQMHRPPARTRRFTLRRSKLLAVLRFITRPFFTRGRHPLLNVLGVAIGLVLLGLIVDLVAGIVVYLATPADSAPGTPASTSTTASTAVAPCQQGACVALRPVKIAAAEGGETLVAPGATVTDATPVSVLGADGVTVTWPYLDVTYQGHRGRAFRLDPNDGGLVFAAVAGK